MTDQWPSFLQAQGAEYDHQGVVRFRGEPNRDSATDLLALDQLGCLWVEGGEARQFLQGQVTCDTNLVSEDHAQRGGHCNQKGRLIFTFLAVQVPSGDAEVERFALIMHRDLLSRAEQALGKFIVFSKAELRNDRDSRLIALDGPQVPRLLGSDFTRLPIANDDVVSAGPGTCVRISGDRLLLLLPRDVAAEAWQRWADQCRPGGYPAWDLANIRDGLGDVLPGCEEMFIPQMLNMHVTGGVSFKKGCYVGQEVVARMHYLGKLKRHMRRARVSEGEIPSPGAPIYSRESKQSVGNVVLSADAGGGREMLMVTTDNAFDSDALYLDAEGHRKLQTLNLPYAIV